MRDRTVTLSGVLSGAYGGNGIEEFHDRCTKAMQSIDPPVAFEVVYVNDGSTDRSGTILLRRPAERHCRMTGLSRNFDDAAGGGR